MQESLAGSYCIIFSVFKLNVLLSCIEPSSASYAIVQKKAVCVIFLILQFVGRIVMELYCIIFSVFKLNVLLSCVEPSRALCAIVQKKVVCVIFLILRFVGRIVMELYCIVFLYVRLCVIGTIRNRT